MQYVKNASRKIGCLPYAMMSILCVLFILGVTSKTTEWTVIGSLSGVAAIATLIYARKLKKIKNLNADIFEGLLKNHNFDSVVNSPSGTSFLVFDVDKRVFFFFVRGVCTQYAFDDVNGYEFHWLGDASGRRRQCRLHLHMNSVECPLLRMPLVDANQMDIWSAKLKAMRIGKQVSG